MKLKRILSILLAIIISVSMVFVPGPDAKAADIAAPTGVVWTRNLTCKWNAVDDATRYYLCLYKKGGSSPVGTQNVTATEYDFGDTIRTNGPGVYYFTVQSVKKEGTVWVRSSAVRSSEVNIITSYSASITAPMPGDEPSHSAGSGDADKYTAEVFIDVQERWYWFRDYFHSTNFMNAGEKFVNGTYYVVGIKFTPAPGYRLLPKNECARLNGRKNGYINSYDMSTNAIVFTFGFKCMDPVEAFVTRLYNICLDREPDSSGFNNWVSLLKSKTRTGTEVAKGFIFSNEFKNKNYCDSCFVKQLYRAFMGREYDDAGLAYWTGNLKKGWKRQQIFNGFSNSTEFLELCNTYGITRGNKISIPALETVVPFNKCSECGAAGLKKYTITYKVNGGTMPSSGVKNWYTVESASYTLPKPTRSGYTFVGWYKESGFTNKVTSIPNGSTGNKTFYAKWKKN